MKVEIEISDLEEMYCGYDNAVTGKDLKQYLVEQVIDDLSDKLYYNYIHQEHYGYMKTQIGEIIKEKKDEIVAMIIERVANEIIKKKAIVDEMPKKSDLKNISKEWEDYFVELIDKAIAKRFK